MLVSLPLYNLRCILANIKQDLLTHCTLETQKRVICKKCRSGVYNLIAFSLFLLRHENIRVGGDLNKYQQYYIFAKNNENYLSGHPSYLKLCKLCHFLNVIWRYDKIVIIE